MPNRTLSILPLLLLLLACNRRPAPPETFAEDLYAELQEQLIAAQPGDVIDIPAGVFEFNRPLSLDGIANITIRGAGMEETVLSFRGQKVGAEGIRVTADSVTIQDLTIRDTKGDGIKLQDCRGITLRNIKTTWSGGADEANGGYGLYPVASTDVLIDGCEASYASDAGIYVGQCRGVVVRNCYAHENVAGIEIENCIDAEVYDNRCEGNTGGLLVFDLPDLPQTNGRNCKVYRNQIIENNHRNFAPEGNIVGIVPPGTGIILLAAKEVEIFENVIKGHKTFGAAIASYHITENTWNDKSYDPFTSNVYLHGNTFERKGGITIPDLTKDFGKLVNVLFKGKPQDILYDGITAEGGAGNNPMNICIDQPADGLRFANIDAANEFADVTTDVTAYRCAPRQQPNLSVSE